MPDDRLVVRLMLIAGLSVAGVGAVLALTLYLFGRRGERSLGPARIAKPEWNGVAVLSAIATFALFTIVIELTQVSLTAIGFFRAIYGPDWPGENGANRAAATVRALWSAAFAFPIQLLIIVALARYWQVANPMRLRNSRTGAIAGYLTWLIVTPTAFCVFVLASLAHVALTGHQPEKHPLTQIGDAAGSIEWGLFVFQTVLIAPVLEEWLFRGVLLAWLVQKRPVARAAPVTVEPNHRPRIVLIAAVCVSSWFTFGSAYLNRSAEVRQEFASDPGAAAANYLIPTAFFTVLLGLDLIPPRFRILRRHLRIRSAQHVRAIWASAVLFGAVHSHVWPSPVPLVVLAVGLGYLYLRTRSLVGPIVVHAMFNAVSALYLVLGGPA